MTVGFCLVGSLFGAGSKGFWSLTLYNDEHLFNPIRWGVIRLGTKNKNLKYSEDGSLALCAEARSRGKESNWLPAPVGTVLAVHPVLLVGPGCLGRHVAAIAGGERKLTKLTK